MTDAVRLRRRLSSLGSIVALLLCAGGARAADAELVKAATAEGQVVWYVSLIQNQFVRPMQAAFEKKYPGIKVNPVTGLQNDLLVKLLGEARAGGTQADVFHGSTVAPLKDANLLQHYVPQEAAAYPKNYKDPDGFWTAEFVYFSAAAINTDLVKPGDAPKTFKDLLDPKWKGKIAWPATLTPGGPPGFIGGVLLGMGEAEGRAFLDRLATQKIVNVAANQRVVMDQVIAGEYPLSLATYSHHAVISAKAGAPVQWLKLEPLTSFLDVIALMKSAPHPNAGKLFIEFILSEEGQKVVAAANYIPARPDVPASTPTLKPDAGNFKALVIPTSVMDKNLGAWVQIYNEKFK